MVIQQDTFDFLNHLAQNNNREWFAAHKADYEHALDNAKAFFSVVHQQLQQHDAIEKQKVYRIYRDIRFSKDKTPYNPRFATSFSRLGKTLRGGYFLQIKPNDSFLAGGFWQPNKEDLFRIRKEFEIDDSEIREVLSEKTFKQYFGGKLVGEELKTAPKGFDKHHPAIDLIRKKGFVAIRPFNDATVLSDTFITQVDESYKALRPFFNLMSDILTTDLNGERL